ncbi:hypothetical protein AbraIFM66950_001287 [Aspergillus brasiliensis]|nr:hypothetical protein AbraIFM66950_001287 [Aspergillus brasiliensis]
MDHGLPGVTQARNTAQVIYRTQGIRLRTMHNAYHELVNQSKWSSRGWTFQEAMFSPKMLLFSKTGVFYECCEVYQEDRFATPVGKRGPIPIFLPCWGYGRLLKEYTKRDLTYDSDVLKAFSGFLNWRYGSDHYFGIPLCEFTESMLWYPISSPVYERPVPRALEASDTFPSWSWSAVKGRISLLSSPSRPTLLGFWGVPSSNTQRESVRLIRPHYAHVGSAEVWYEGSFLSALGVALAWKEGCLPSPSPPILNASTTWQEYRSVITSKWTSVDHLTEEALGVGSSQAVEQIDRVFPSSYLKSAGHPGALLAHTQSLRAQMVRRIEDSLVELRPVSGISVIVKVHSGTTNFDWIFDDYSKAHDNSGHLDVLALSITYGLSKGEASTGQSFLRDSQGDYLCKWPFSEHRVFFSVNVMIVKTRDGLSRRQALGQVDLWAWISASPYFHNFILV